MKRTEFIEFLLAANKAGYADPNAAVKNHPEGGHEIVYANDDAQFADYWYGGNPFAGQEAVAVNGKTMWAMQYRGGVPEGVSVGEAEVFSFLKKALAECSKDEPLRGPKEFSEGDWRYTNEWSHDLAEFTGHEEITYKGEIVHVTDYFGGLVDSGAFAD